jgi:hypothetical protein
MKASGEKASGGLLKGLGAAAAVGVLLMFGLDAAAQSTRTPSPCKGLDEKACRAKTADCAWVVPKKGKQPPYCRLRPGRKAKS